MSLRTFSYQWQRYTGGAWADIAGATAKHYTVQVADTGCPLRLEVTPSDGSTPAYSNPTDPALGAALLWVDFTTPAAAPITVYAGLVESLTLLDASGIYSVAGGVLVPNAVSLGSSNPRVRSTNTLALSNGLALIQRLRMDSALGAPSGTLRIGFSTSAGTPAVSDIAGLRPNPSSSVWSAQDTGSIDLPDAFALDTNYVVGVILRPSGGYQAFIDGARVWVADSPVIAAAVYAHSTPGSAGITPATFTYWRALAFPAPFDSDFGDAALHQAAPVSGSDYAGAANALFDGRTVVLDAAPSAGLVALEVRYNKIDANNYYWARIVRNGGNTAWNLLAGKVVAGVSTTLLTVTGVGTPDRLRVVRSDSAHDFYTAAAGTWTKRGAQVTDSSLAAASGVSAVIGGTTTVGWLDVWARDSAAAAEYGILEAAE